MLSRVARSGAARAGFATAAASSDASSPGVRGAFRTVVALGLAGATAFVVEDTLNDLALWRICRNRAAPVIEFKPAEEKKKKKKSFGGKGGPSGNKFKGVKNAKRATALKN